MRRQALLVCFASFLLLGAFKHCQECIDTLRNERGDVFIRNWPEKPGDDYEKDVVVFKTKPGALIIKNGKFEASIDQCEMGEDLKSVLEEAGAYYIKKVFPLALPNDTLHIIDDSLITVVPDLSNDFLAL
jgi:hypothetical protein